MRSNGWVGCRLGKIRYDNLKSAVAQGAVGPRPRGVRALGGVPVALRVRRVLLPARPRRGRTRRAGWRVRAAGSAAPTASRCRWWTRSAELNELLAAADARDDHRRIGNRLSHGRSATSRLERPAAAAVAGRAVPDLADADTAGGPVRPDHGAQLPVLGARAVDRAPGTVRLRASELLVFDGRPRSPGTNARPSRAAGRWCWTTTWRCWPASPGRCPARPRWRRPAPPGCSPAAHDGVLGRRPEGPRRRRRHPRPGRGAAAAPPPAPRRRGRRHHRSAGGRRRSARTWSPSRPANASSKPTTPQMPTSRPS